MATRALIAAATVGLLALASSASRADVRADYVQGCTQALVATRPLRPVEEHRGFCACIADESAKRGAGPEEFAAEVERMARDPAGAATGRIREAAVACFEARIRELNARGRAATTERRLP